MWEVDQIKQVDGKVMFAFTKIGTYAVAAPEEIFFAESSNLLTAKKPADVTWEIFPKTDHGTTALLLRAQQLANLLLAACCLLPAPCYLLIAAY